MHRNQFRLQTVGILGLYAALAVAGTYPLFFQAARAIPAGGDSWVNYWNIAWIKKALLEQGVNPYFTPDLHFPYGTSLYFHTLNFLPSVIALPVAFAFGIPAAFNFLVFLSFVLSGYGTYRLALYVLPHEIAEAKDKQTAVHLAAFIAGIAFAFSSYRYIHLLGHLDLVSTQWLPLFVLFLLKTRDEGGWKNVGLAALLLAATMLTAAYYVVFLLVFMAAVVAELIFRRRRDSWSTVLRIAGIVFVFVLIVSPILVPMLIAGGTEGRTVDPTSDMIRFSTDAVAFVVPSPLHPLWREFVSPIYRAIAWPGSNIEIVAFAGFVPLILALIGVKRLKAMRRLWLPLVILFSILALGPVIHVAGRVVLPQLSFIMPYRLLALLPYGDIPRVPARYVVMTIVGHRRWCGRLRPRQFTSGQPRRFEFLLGRSCGHRKAFHGCSGRQTTGLWITASSGSGCGPSRLTNLR